MYSSYFDGNTVLSVFSSKYLKRVEKFGNAAYMYTDITIKKNNANIYLNFYYVTFFVFKN